MHDVGRGGNGAGHQGGAAIPPVHVQGGQYDQAFALLPVLDLVEGQVVAARAGQRERYAPIRSPLAAGSDPEVMLGALLQAARSRSAYVADLDAIRHGRPQVAVIRRLLQAFGAVSLWLDGGFASAQAGLDAAAVLEPRRVRPVLGTETLGQAEDLSTPQRAGTCLLSLDFGPEGFRGDPAWLSLPSRWPRQLVVMTLGRVGMAQGPDLDCLRDVIARAGGRQVWAAGGVRDARDVAELARLGVAGALVATALHEGRLPG